MDRERWVLGNALLRSAESPYDTVSMEIVAPQKDGEATGRGVPAYKAAGKRALNTPQGGKQ